MIAFPPMSETLYSIRMRASFDGQHVCGAERVVARASACTVANELLNRAFSEGVGEVDEAHCTLDRIDPGQVRYEKLPDVTTFEVDCCGSGRLLSARLLYEAGVPEAIAEQAVQLLALGAAPGGRVMRGAVLMDIQSGKRLETDPERGVRVSRMDIAEAKRSELLQRLADEGLTHHRVCEALVLAGKVATTPGIVAELCWSDAPDYLPGYVCSAHNGYQRITKMKKAGDKTGGRIFFVDRDVADVKDIIAYLERQPVLFDDLGMMTACKGQF